MLAKNHLWVGFCGLFVFSEGVRCLMADGCAVDVRSAMLGGVFGYAKAGLAGGSLISDGRRWILMVDDFAGC